MDFYERVKQIVKERGFSLTQFYTMIGLNPHSIKNAKAIKAQPKLDVALTIAKTLDLSVEYLATGEDVKEGKDFPQWKDLIDEQRVAIRQFIALNTEDRPFKHLCQDIARAYEEQQSDARANGAHG
ncbi:helix-turn-helix transcriptional regulator (plasmid) [Entomospira entomophila]|uniref:Helix-turn-helix transcriptional regulator n=1 Tax=Entomospira entomophila TaxID=2719988 RepID=A0A968GAD6_9SPIO|nr:helix-turn-helix transcriptional regulator [Entomospira entomophilus]NIZ41525.1 helix-turn-helix transcriptional regulator [Entomospira entomophilus]WDI36447.1 helix-turn-helix transcriptional regulator [Entomospira entomophilus]